VKKKISCFEAAKKSSNNFEKLFYALIAMKPKSAQISGTREGFFSHGPIVTKLRNRLNDESVLRLSCVSIINIIEKLCLT